jgi:glucokinase
MSSKASPKAAKAAKQKPLAIGIDMGGTSVKMGVCDGSQLLFHAEPIPTKGFKKAKDLIAAMVDTVSTLRAACPGIKAVGIGVPGFTDFATGLVHNLTNVPGWKGIQLNDVLTKATGVPSFAENDANCMAYAEFCHGAGRGSRNMIGVTLGTGVGGGLVIDGKLFRGSFSGAGEIGQMSIDYQGKPGHYGNTGALEEYVGNVETTNRAQTLYEAAGRSMDSYTPQALAAAGKKKDPIALQVWNEYASQLACALSNCIYLLNPDTLVIGGGVARAGALLFGPLKKKLAAQLAPPFYKPLKITPAEFGNEAGIIGSAAVALERVG